MVEEPEYLFYDINNAGDLWVLSKDSLGRVATKTLEATTEPIVDIDIMKDLHEGRCVILGQKGIFEW